MMRKPWYKQLFCKHTYIHQGYETGIDVCSCGCGNIYEIEYEISQCDKCNKIKKREVYRTSQVKEILAEYAHKQWAGWMIYLFEKSTHNKDGTVTIPKWAVDRWERQMKTPYAELSESEKESDRKEAEGMMQITRRQPYVEN
jgi:hypothetical protein